MAYALRDLSDSVSSTTLVRQFVWQVPEVTTCAAQWYIQGNAYFHHKPQTLAFQ
jgi:hypothetical protein